MKSEENTDVIDNKQQINFTPTPSNIIQEKEPLSWRFWRKQRYIVVLMSFFGFFNVYTLRVNLSVAIVAMTNNRTVTDENGVTTYVQDFPWTSTERGLILSSFFYGYITTQFIGGYVANRLGGNLVFGAGIFITAVFTLFTPLAANAGFAVLIVVRVIEGVCEGVTFPCIHAIWSRWAPPFERSRMATIAFSGTYAGTIVAMPVCGVLAEKYGWESLFYVFGGIGVLWYILWVLIVREGPENNRFISKDELVYITSNLGTSGRTVNISHPWKDIFTSSAVYAIVASHFCENWGFYTMLTQLPSFLNDVLKFDLNSTGVLSAVPYMVMFLLLGVSGYFADLCQVKKWLTTTQVRRYFNCFAFISQTIFMLLAAFMTVPAACIACISIAVGLGACAWCGFSVNHLDIAPLHASVLMGISNTFATIPGIVSPTLTGVIVQNQSREEWRAVFYITSGVYLVGCLIYWFYASGELQPWAIAAMEKNRIDNEELERKKQDEEKCK